MKIHDPMLQRVAVGVALALLVLACLNILRPFFGPLLWAVILTVTAWPVFVWMKERLPGRPILSSVFTSIVIAIFCLIPITYGVADAACLLVDLCRQRLGAVSGGKRAANRGKEWVKQARKLDVASYQDRQLLGVNSGIY